MRILLANDDGIFAPGIAAIYKELIKIAEVVVAAPTDCQSGAGHSITFQKPLLFNKVNIDGKFTGYSVQGSPADCVKIAVMELQDKPFDMVVSGINSGANAGINVFYSGTVAAAMEAAFYRIPAVAMSLSREENMDFGKAAKHCTKILKKLLPLTPGDVISINIPRLSKGKPKGVRVVPQSTEGFNETYTLEKDELGQTIFQLNGGTPRAEENIKDTISLAEGFITVTALHFDMTHYEKNRELKNIKF